MADVRDTYELNTKQAGDALDQLFAKAKALDAELAKAGKGASVFSASLASIGRADVTGVLKGVGVAVTGVAAGLVAATKKAADFQETVSKTNAVLGSAAGPVRAYADEVADKFGLVKQQTLDAASGFGALGKGLGGLQGQGLADFSIQFTQLAADLSSFANIDFSEASRSLLVQLSGEQSDTLKRLGVVTTEAAVQQYAFANGIAKVGSELNDQQKIAARAGLIMKGLADAQGDLERTADSAANRLRKLQGQAEQAAVAIGTELIGAMQSLVSLASEVGQSFRDAFGIEPIKAFGEELKAVFDTLRVLNKLPEAGKAKQGQQSKGQQQLDSANLAIVEFFGAGDTEYAKRLRKRLQDVTDKALGTPSGTPAPTPAEVAAVTAKAAGAGPAAALSGEAERRALAESPDFKANVKAEKDAAKEAARFADERLKGQIDARGDRAKEEDRRIKDLAGNVGPALESEALTGGTVDRDRVARALQETQGLDEADADRAADAVLGEFLAGLNDRIAKRAGEKGLTTEGATADLAGDVAKERREEAEQRTNEKVDAAKEASPLAEQVARATAGAVIGAGGGTAYASAAVVEALRKLGVGGEAALAIGKEAVTGAQKDAFSEALKDEGRKVQTFGDTGSFLDAVQSAVGGAPDLAKQQVDKLAKIEQYLARADQRAQLPEAGGATF